VNSKLLIISVSCVLMAFSLLKIISHNAKNVPKMQCALKAITSC